MLQLLDVAGGRDLRGAVVEASKKISFDVEGTAARQLADTQVNNKTYSSVSYVFTLSHVSLSSFCPVEDM